MGLACHGKKLEQELDKAWEELRGYVDTSFKYFQDLLDESLVSSRA